jgi:Zn-finger nucleic acid-binding protein
MDCPVCKDTQLVMTERQNIEIDYCPKCRGVWLDRGELDKLIERSQQYESERASSTQTFSNSSQQRPPAAVPPQPYYGGHGESQFGHSSGHHREDNRGSGHGRGHGGFLKRLFD